MAQTVCVMVNGSEKARLEAIVADRNRLQKHVERARVVLASAQGQPVQRVATLVGVSRPMVWRWQQRFAEEGMEGLLRDKTRKPGKAPIAADTVARVVAMTCATPPHEATHWTGRAMAKAVGISLRSVQRIWDAHKLQPHRLRTFKRSRDPEFATKLVDIVGLYVDPPEHAVVLSIDEKSQIQALDRTQPGRPLKPGRCATMTHDYKRHGTTTLFAALNLLDGTVIGRCMQRHRHEEFIRFLKCRARRSRRKTDRSRRRQRRDPQTSKGEGLACASPALDISFYADIRILVERGRDLLLGADPQAHSPRQFSFGSRPASRHQAISRRA